MQWIEYIKSQILTVLQCNILIPRLDHNVAVLSFGAQTEGTDTRHDLILKLQEKIITLLLPSGCKEGYDFKN
jgi:hypothetical protein